MARYFFNMRSSDSYIADEEGDDLPNITAVRNAAITAAREIVAERIKSGRDSGVYKFEITDSHGDVVLTVNFNEALPQK